MPFPGTNITLLNRLLAFPGGSGVEIVTAAGNVTITLAQGNFLAYDCGGASRDMTMPDTKGRSVLWLLANMSDDAETWTVKDPAGNTLKTVAQNAGGLIWTNGTTWDAVSFTIAL